MLCFRRHSVESRSNHTDDLSLINHISDFRPFLNTPMSCSVFIMVGNSISYVFDDGSESVILNRGALENCGGIFDCHNSREGNATGIEWSGPEIVTCWKCRTVLTTKTMPHLVQFSNVPMKVHKGEKPIYNDLSLEAYSTLHINKKYSCSFNTK